MKKEDLIVTKDDKIIRNGLMTRFSHKDFKFRFHSSKHDELIHGVVNETFLTSSVEDIKKSFLSTDVVELSKEEYESIINDNTVELMVSNYEESFYTHDEYPFEYKEKFTKLFGFCAPYVREEIDRIKRNNGFLNWNPKHEHPTMKFQINTLENIHHNAEDSWNRIIHIHELYLNNTFDYRFNIIDISKRTKNCSYIKYGIIIDGYEMIDIKEYILDRDEEVYIIIYKTDYMRGGSQEFIVIYNINPKGKFISKYPSDFIKKRISYSGGPDAVLKAYLSIESDL